MDSADLFRHILTTKTLPEETKLGYEFRFKTVFYNDGASYCCCRCAYDHEYFSYISESGDIDWEKCEPLVQAIKDGRCQHAARATKKVPLSETMVNVFHISAALGSETLLRELLKVEGEIELKSRSIKSGLFYMDPDGVAALRGNDKVVQMMPPKHLYPVNINWYYSNTCIQNVLHVAEKEQNIFQITNSSILEVCIIKGHTAIVKMLLCDLCRKYIHDGYGTRIYESLFKYNLTEMLDPILSDENVFPKPPSDCACTSLKARCLGCGSYDRRLMEFWEIVELGVIYNVRDIFFNKSIQRLYDALLCSEKYRHYRKPLFETCRAFQRHDVLELLSANECQNLYTESISETQIFVNLFMLLKKYTLSGHHIGSVMKQIPDIERIVNAPFGAIVGSGYYGYWDLCPGLTPLQSYMCIHDLRFFDVSVVRTLIDCGADIDQMFPPNFKDDERKVYPRGNTVLMHILNKEEEFNRVFREILELLLYENVAVALNDSAVSLCLKRYHYQIEPSDWESDSDIITIEERTDSRKHKGIYVMDSCVRASPFFYTVPLLIEAGFKYSLADVETVLFPENELVKVKDELNQLREETRRPYHIERMAPSCHVSEYLEQCLRTPRALKLRCRDVLRSHYPRRQIHKYVSCVEISEKIKDFLLLKPILQTLSVDREY